MGVRPLTKPPPVRLHPPRLRLVLPLLERRRLDDLAVLVAHRLAAVEHLQSRDLLRIAVEILPLHALQGDLGGRGAWLG